VSTERVARWVARADAREAVRSALRRRGYVELDAPLLVRGTCPDLSLTSFAVPEAGPGAYLTTSTEYAIKRALAEGLGAAFTLTANFRRGEVSPTHGPEFTMLEWGRVGANLDEICAEAEALVEAAARAVTGGTRVAWGGRALDLAGPWPRRGVAEVLAAATGLPREGALTLPWLLAAAARLGIDVPPSWADDVVTVLTLALDHLQPTLGADGPMWLVDWPGYLTSSTDGGADATTARAELFCGGLELADGFPFLTDAEAAQAALERAQAARAALGLDAVTVDDGYLRALRRGLPDGAGMALGFDRLVMLLTGATRIVEVQVQGWDER
jgi:lysyl-tRNA synthetase class 2